MVEAIHVDVARVSVDAVVVVVVVMAAVDAHALGTERASPA